MFGDVVRRSKERVGDPIARGLRRYVGLEHLDPGSLRIRRWGDVSDGTTFTSVFRPGQVLFGKRRAYQHKVAVADFEGVCSGDIYVLEPRDPSILLPELLPFVCQSDGFLDHAVETSAGSLSPRTNWESLAGFEFTLGSPEAQAAVSKILIASSTVVESYERARSDHSRVLLAMSNELASLGSTQRPIADLLLDVIDFRGRTPKKLKMSWGGDIAALSARNVLMGRIDLGRDTNYGSDALYRRWMTKGDLRKGDILFTTEAPLGNVCLLEDDRRFILSQRVVALRPDPAIVEPSFLVAVLRSADFRRALAQRTTGSTATGVRVAALKEIPVNIPGLDAQQAATETLGRLEEAEGRISERHSTAVKVHRGLLTAVFSGERG